MSSYSKPFVHDLTNLLLDEQVRFQNHEFDVFAMRQFGEEASKGFDLTVSCLLRWHGLS